MKLAWQIRALFALATLNLLYWILRLNPHLGSYVPLSIFTTEQTTRSYQAAVIQGAARGNEPNSLPNSLPTFQYRESTSRSGVHTQSYVPLNLREAWHSQKINIGIHTASKASPAVDASGVYVGSDNSWFYKFSLDGQLIWSFQLTNAARGIHGTALLDEDFVYFGGYNGRLYCLRKSDGQLRWVVKLVDAVGSSAVLSENALYVSSESGFRPEGYLFKLDRTTAKTLWYSQGLGEQVHSSPTLDENAQTVFVGANNGNIYAFNSADGQRRWQGNLEGAIKSTIVYRNGKLYASSWGKKLFALDSESGKILWNVDLQATSQSSPTYVPDSEILVVGTKNPASLQGISIKEQSIRWKIAIGGDDPTQVLGSGVAVRPAAGRDYYVWISCGTNRLCAVEPKAGKILRQIELPGSLSGVPTVYGDSLFVALNRGPVLRLSPSLDPAIMSIQKK